MPLAATDTMLLPAIELKTLVLLDSAISPALFSTNKVDDVLVANPSRPFSAPAESCKSIYAWFALPVPVPVIVIFAALTISDSLLVKPFETNRPLALM